MAETVLLVKTLSLLTIASKVDGETIYINGDRLHVVSMGSNIYIQELFDKHDEIYSKSKGNLTKQAMIRELLLRRGIKPSHMSWDKSKPKKEL